MDVKLNKLLCLIDGKITYYRMITTLNDIRVKELIRIQKDIQELYDLNQFMES